MSQAKAIPERIQIAPEYTWNTADLYPTDQAWQEDFSRLQAMVPNWPPTPAAWRRARTPCTSTSPWSRRPGSCW